MEKRNITEMSFDEIFPEQSFPQNDNKYSDYGSSLSDDYDESDFSSAQEQDHYSMPDDRYSLPSGGSDKSFTDNAYSLNEAARPVFPDVQGGSIGNNSSANYTSPPQAPFTPDKAGYYQGLNNRVVTSANNGKGLIFGIISLIFSMGGIGLIFAIIGLVSVSKAAEPGASDEKAESSRKTAKTVCIIGLVLNILVLIYNISSQFLPDIIHMIAWRRL